ncbi:hypothetical protein [Mesorhizobium shangrilense]|uniref:Uncharacterized protein n=1 Tax=Mesorhizobium shangrilense TaxID=460060 RepID=A0ABV2DS65_9HYPH
MMQQDQAEKSRVAASTTPTVGVGCQTLSQKCWTGISLWTGLAAESASGDQPVQCRSNLEPTSIRLISIVAAASSASANTIGPRQNAIWLDHGSNAKLFGDWIFIGNVIGRQV